MHVCMLEVDGTNRAGGGGDHSCTYERHAGWAGRGPWDRCAGHVDVTACAVACVESPSEPAGALAGLARSKAPPPPPHPIPIPPPLHTPTPDPKHLH